jgi:hypothetical protein
MPAPPGQRREAEAPRDIASGLDALAQRFGGQQRDRGSSDQQRDTKQSQRAKQERERTLRKLRGEEPQDSQPSGDAAPS